jgi:hypothetical protein
MHSKPFTKEQKKGNIFHQNALTLHVSTVEFLIYPRKTLTMKRHSLKFPRVLVWISTFAMFASQDDASEIKFRHQKAINCPFCAPHFQSMKTVQCIQIRAAL